MFDTDRHSSYTSFLHFKQNSLSYRQSLQDWWNALDDLIDQTPSLATQLNLVNANKQPADKAQQSVITRLQNLPIFALILVLPKGHFKPSDPDFSADYASQTFCQNWMEEQTDWQIMPVLQKNALNLEPISQSIASFVPNSTITSKQSLTITDSVVLVRALICPQDSNISSSDQNEEYQQVIKAKIAQQIKQKLLQNDSENLNFDYYLLGLDKLLGEYRLACFDMDSTLIEQEVIVELAKFAKIGDQVSAITESAMRGEIDFDESFTQRVALLEGLSVESLAGIRDNLTLSSGAVTTLAVLKALGVHTVLVSGGFDFFAQHVASTLGMDEFFANPLDTQDGKVTGKVVQPIINGAKKAEIVQKIAQQQGISLTQTACIGDGANDLPMMAIANLGLAYHAKPIVQKQADLAINLTGLEGVLYALGIASV